MKKYNKTSRLIAFVLSIAMLIGVCPLQAFAADNSLNTQQTTSVSKSAVKSQIVLKENFGNVKLYKNNDLSINFDRFREDLFNAVYDAEKSTPNNLTYKDVNWQYDASRLSTIPIWQALEFVDSTNVQRAIAEGGSFKFRMILPETAEHSGTRVEFTATVEKAPLVETKINFTNKTITYSKDVNALKQELFKSAIDWKNSTLPNNEQFGIEYFTFEYYAENVLSTGKPGGIKKWVPIEGGKFALLNYPAISAGEHQIRISFKGNSEFTSAVAEKAVTIKKARTTVTVKTMDKFADEKLPADFVTTSIKDNFEIFTIFIGTTSATTGSLCIDLPDSITESFLIDLLNPIVKLVIGKSMDDIINNGITVQEINAVVNSQAMKDLIEKLHIDLGIIGTLLNILEKLPPSLQKFSISFSDPKVAGLYNVVALAINPNYETGFGVGILNNKMRNQTTELKYNQEINGRKLTVEEAKNFDFGATLSYQGTPVADQSSVSYIYTGVQSNGRPYSSKTTPPTEPGTYTQTVCIIGGNYMASPVTRTFKIVK